MKRLSFLFFLAALFIFSGCNDVKITEDYIFNSVKQVDIKLVVPIDDSSLEYFDFIIEYYDNNGITQKVRVTKEGVIDEFNSKTPLSEGNYYIKNYAYDKIPVSCVAKVKLEPKCDMDDIVSFSYYNPKPYFFSRIVFSNYSTSAKEFAFDPNKIGERITITDMSVEDFLSKYGREFISHYQVKNEYGIDTFFY